MTPADRPATSEERVEWKQIAADRTADWARSLHKVEELEAEVARLTRQIDATVGVVERDNSWRDAMKARAEAAEAQVEAVRALADEADRRSLGTQGQVWSREIRAALTPTEGGES